MDLSKLPRMSQTPARPDPAQPTAPGEPLPGQPAPGTVVYAQPPRAHVDVGLGAEVWFSAVLGLVFILMGLSFAQWLVATLAGRPFDTGVVWQAGENAGQPVRYFELAGGTAWTDTATFLFGLALLLEAAALIATAKAGAGLRRATIALALLVTVAATALNVGVAVYLLTIGIRPFVSLLLAAFGGYMAFYLFGLWRALGAARHDLAAR